MAHGKAYVSTSEAGSRGGRDSATRASTGRPPRRWCSARGRSVADRQGRGQMRAYRMSPFWGRSAGKSVCARTWTCAYTHRRVCFRAKSSLGHLWAAADTCCLVLCQSGSFCFGTNFFSSSYSWSSLLQTLTHGSRGTEGCKSDEAEWQTWPLGPHTGICMCCVGLQTEPLTWKQGIHGPSCETASLRGSLSLLLRIQSNRGYLSSLLILTDVYLLVSISSHNFIKIQTAGNSLVVQLWGLGTFIAESQVQSLVGELRCHKPYL